MPLNCSSVNRYNIEKLQKCVIFEVLSVHYMSNANFKDGDSVLKIYTEHIENNIETHGGTDGIL